MEQETIPNNTELPESNGEQGKGQTGGKENFTLKLCRLPE
jgi:hypothetical protein